MLGRISRGLGHKTGKKGVKYRFDVVVEKLDNLPSPVKKCRVVWSRGPKLQMTEIRDVNKGAVAFKQKLSQIATMYHDAKGGWEPKEYKFQIQVPGKEDNKLLTVGRADLDMSLYVLSEGTAQSKMLPILFKVGMASTGYLKISITAEEVASGTDSDDGMTEVSGMTGMTANLGEDQDLSGFDEDRSAQASGPNSTTTSRPSSRMSTASPPKAEIKAAPAAAAVASAAAVAPAAAAASKPSSSPASRAKPSAKAAAQDPGDDEISPMSLSPASSGELSQRAAGSKQPARAAGKPSVVDKKGAEDAREELFGTGKPSKPATSPSSSSYSTKQEPLLSEEDARAALFSTTTSTSSKRSSSVSTPAAAKLGKASSSSKQPAAPDPEKAIPPKAAAATSAASPTAVAVSGAGTISVVAAAGTGAGAGVRRGLLDRSSLQDKQQAQAPSPAADTGPSSSKPAAYRNTHGHSLSDSDDDSTAPAQAGLKQPSAAANRALQGTAAASKAKQQQQQQPGVQPPASPAPPDASSAAASKVLSSENEKLKAQLLALRQQAAEAEESRRLAVLAADNAASERDEYRGQVQELQEQLKEALVSLMTQEEAEELKQELQDLRQQVAAHQQQQDQQDHQQQLHAAEAQAWRAERSQLQQAVEDAQAAAAKAQQHADKQLQQLQANADSQEGLVRHLSWQLEAAQQALQQQQHDDDEQQQQQQSSQLDVGSAAVPGCVLAEVATDKACSAARILQFLADEVQELSRQEAVHQCLTDQLLGEASSAAGALELDGTVQGPVLEVLVGLRAAATALQCLQAEQAALQQSVASLTATLSKSQQEAASLQLLSSNQASTAAANIRKLQAEVTQLQQENMQLAMQQSPAATPLKLGVQPDNAQQQQGSPKGKTGMLSNKQPPSSLVGTSLIAAGTAADTPCKACASLQEQLSAAQHKTTKLTAARDKLEIILHDLEAASAEEREQMEHQLAAANKAFRSSSQQLTSVQQQLKQTQQDLLDREQQLEAAKQQHEAAQEDLAEKEQQLGAAQQQLEEAQQQLQAAQQQLTRLHELPELSQQSNPQQAAVGSAVPPPSYEAATNAAAATAASATQVIAMAESAGPSGVEQALSAAQDQVADLQRQLAEAEGVRRGLEKDLARARKQLADEQSDRNTLEEHIITRLEDSGDDVAQETVAAYEAKYNRLKSRYRELTELHSEEVDKLHDEINTLQERVVELEALAAQLEAARTQAQHGEVTLADTLAKASRATSELTTLRSENQMLTQNLIAIKMELALCCEREVIGRHELYKSRETNLKLASKMTKLETLVYANKK